MNDNTIVSTIRHGETDFNRQRRYAGTLDVPLNGAGIRDTVDAASKMNGTRFDAVITSTLRRSIQTARYLFGKDIKTVQTHLCCERNYGGMQGMTEDEVKAMRPKIMYIHEGGDYHSINPPGGESFEELRQRAESFFDFVLDNYEGKKVLVVSHFTFLQQFHGLIKGRDWITSLGESIGNLQFYTFSLQGNRLIGEETVPLLAGKQSNW